MRSTHIIVLAGLVLLAEAALGSIPGIIATREGGMGLGSALIVGQATQVAGVALGAILAVPLVRRRSVPAALIAGALLFYGGVIGVGHQPAHHLGWVVVILLVAGIGMGIFLTVAFVAAATTARLPATLAALLFAPVASSLLLGTPLYRPGPPALVLTAAVVLAGAVGVAWLALRRDRPGSIVADPDGAEPRLSGRRAATLGGLVALGVVAALWGVEGSGVSVTMVARSLGLPGLASLDGLRVGLLVGGLLLLVLGVVRLVRAARPGRATLLAVGASGAAALAAAGLLATAGFAMPRELTPPDSGGGPVGELTAVAASAAGLGLGAWLLAGRVRPPALAAGGAAILAALAAVALLGGGTIPGLGGPAGPVAAIALAAFGAGLAAVALRFVLASAPPGERAIAAAGGVAAAAVGAMAGLMIGAADGMSRAIGTTSGPSVGSAVVLGAALAATALGAALAILGSPARVDRREVLAAPADVERPAP